MTLSDYIVDPTKSVESREEASLFLFYGISGSGKTYTSMTAANKNHEVIVIDTELRAEKKRKRYFGDEPIRVIEVLQLGSLVQLPTLEGLDSEKIISRTMNVLIEIYKEDVAGKLKSPIVVVDTISEIWKFVQEAGKRRLARAGKIDMDTLSLNRQFDWGTITAQHYKLILMCRLLVRRGINVILTSRANWIPEYVNEKQDTYMMSQKDVPFLSDAVVQFRRKQNKAGVMIGDVTAIIEKAGDEDITSVSRLTNPVFNDIAKRVSEV